MLTKAGAGGAFVICLIVASSALGTPAGAAPRGTTAIVSTGPASWVDSVPWIAQRPTLRKALDQILDPWFFFGMTAQFVFFMRFVVQWIASERKKRSTVPISFWYLSLVGSLALFVYSVHRFDLVFMAAQLLACVIYVRNLMLISQHRKRRLQAGLPVHDLDDSDEGGSSVASKSSAR